MGQMRVTGREVTMRGSTSSRALWAPGAANPCSPNAERRPVRRLRVVFRSPAASSHSFIGDDGAYQVGIN